MMSQRNDRQAFQVTPEGVVWMAGKMEHAVRSIASTFDRLRSEDSLSEDVDYFLTTALGYSLRVLALLSGADYEDKDLDLVKSEGHLGHEQLLVKFSDPDRFRSNRRFYNLASFSRSVLELLQGERSPNRTLIHELLDHVKIRSPIIDRLADLTEEVTMGRLAWDDYVKQATDLLAQEPREDPFS